MNSEKTTNAAPIHGIVIPRVVELKNTCPSCPAQWEGRTDDGRHVYIRYRWGWLQIGVHEDFDTAVRDRENVAQLGGEYDGTLGEDDMKQAASSVLRFAG